MAVKAVGLDADDGAVGLDADDGAVGRVVAWGGGAGGADLATGGGRREERDKNSLSVVAIERLPHKGLIFLGWGFVVV